MSKNKLIAIISIIILLLGLGVTFFVVNKDDEEDKKTVTNYQECVDATGTILESYPEQCVYENATYTRKLTDEEKQALEDAKENIATGKMNQDVTLKDRTINITSITRNYDYKNSGGNSVAIEEGLEYVKVIMQMINTSDVDISYKLTEFSINDTIMKRNVTQLSLDLDKYPSTLPGYGRIGENDKIYLYVVGKVTKDAQNLTFIYQNTDWGNDRIEIDLSE